MNRHQRAKLLPELMRFAGDASLDHITRTWIFDALRDVTGEALPDEPSQWLAWYAKQTGGHTEQEIVRIPWLPR